MSIFNPETAEDKMAQVPFFCCAVPLAILVVVAAVTLWLVLR